MSCSLEPDEDGSMQVQKIQCARVYHVNVVLRIRTSVQDTRKDKAYKEKSLQIQRFVCPCCCENDASIVSDSDVCDVMQTWHDVQVILNLFVVLCMLRNIYAGAVSVLQSTARLLVFATAVCNHQEIVTTL